MNHVYQSPLPTAEAARRLRAYPALVAACRAAYNWLASQAPAGAWPQDYTSITVEQAQAAMTRLGSALAAAGEEPEPEPQAIANLQYDATWGKSPPGKGEPHEL